MNEKIAKAVLDALGDCNDRAEIEKTLTNALLFLNRGELYQLLEKNEKHLDTFLELVYLKDLPNGELKRRLDENWVEEKAKRVWEKMPTDGATYEQILRNAYEFGKEHGVHASEVIRYAPEDAARIIQTKGKRVLEERRFGPFRYA